MDLREYLFFKRKTFAQFAREIDYSPNHIIGVSLGRYRASKKLANAILKNTEGKVTQSDLDQCVESFKKIKSEEYAF